MSLRKKIELEIRKRGPIPFSRYMEICLFDPELGYYASHADQFGKTGDFYTSSDVHAVFGRLLARQFEEAWRRMGSPAQIQLLELGPGRGLFAQDVLDWSERKFPDFFSSLRYTLLEASPALRDKLAQTLEKQLASGKVSLAQTMAGAMSEPTIVFANEFFDAFPVEVVSDQGSLRVVLENNELREMWVPCNSEELDFIAHYGVHPQSGERIEVPLAAQRYMAGLAAEVKTALFIIIDYGYTRKEQLAGFHRGTLMTYRQHSASIDPYEAPGEQDITAHINFTALAAAAEQAGMQVQPLVTQSQFLLGIGQSNEFADVFAETRMPQERAKRALQLKHLIAPEGMGETFRVLVASKGIENVAGLSGLNFGKK